MILDKIPVFLIGIAALCLISHPSLSQNATYRVSDEMYNTYPYGGPNPIPVLTTNPKIYPYHKFDEYSQKSTQQKWKTVTLENQYVKVVILPDVGGKVWAGIEKSTGGEFLYANDAIKFRNIAMRGPWTSGGIEFNFGIVGHSPSTASPVDYTVRENADGSVSCVVGNFDLPSRSTWQVTITLQKDKAYFETSTIWYNNTPLNQSYYNWMTAAAAATEDLEFVFPGDQYLTHPGDSKPWPVDSEGRELNYYKNNAFESSKSYHVVGSDEEYFGGYYHDSKFGFGHWSPYDEMPGAKLWVWSLARDGGIWEDLLTDKKGQYIEFQAGRLFDQYSPGPQDNPIRNVPHAAYSADRWQEIWFPYKEIGGMVDASPVGVLNVERDGSDIYVGICALQYIKDTLRIFDEKGNIRTKRIELNPMDVYKLNIEYLTPDGFNVILGDKKLSYSSSEPFKKVSKPFTVKPFELATEAEKTYTNAMDAMAFREYAVAETLFNKLVGEEQLRMDAYLGLAELKYRKGMYKEGLELANKVMGMNIYHPRANFLAGLGFQAQGDYINAMEAYGWAARSPEFKSAAYTQMAIVALAKNDPDNAMRLASYALDYDRYNIKALNTLAVSYRVKGMRVKHIETVESILNIVPLNHFARYEKGFYEEKKYMEGFLPGINNEFPHESLMEIA
ncbi:MAG: DUF5107 domain-containing protein, partial [Cyclobacteriaceae bacterium]|nr:DUF5107 domain-containing protein [Cyclobacteriaceae bacterium]